MVQHPEVLWAQRSSDTEEEKNILYITVNLPNIQTSTLDYKLTSTSVHFKAIAGDPSKNIPEKEYAFDLEFFEEVDPEKSIQKLNTRSLNLIVRKKEKKAEYWPRLTKEKVKNAFLKTDFSKWVDEDEQGDAKDDIPDEDDMGGMGGMGGMPGMGGMGGMDLESMLAQMNAGGAGGSGAPPNQPTDADSDSDDEGPPPLEDAQPPK